MITVTFFDLTLDSCQLQILSRRCYSELPNKTRAYIYQARAYIYQAYAYIYQARVQCFIVSTNVELHSQSVGLKTCHVFLIAYF